MQNVLRYAREAGLRSVLVHPDPRTRARRLASEFHPLPWDDAHALLGLVRGLRGRAGQVGVLACEEGALAVLPALTEVLPNALAPRATLERLARESAATNSRAARLDLFAFFRDGALVPGGPARRTRYENGDEQSSQPSGFSAERVSAAVHIVEDAARAAGLTRGFLQATLGETADGFVLERIVPGVLDDLGATEVARLAYGRSPLQAWCAHLAGAGSPFDELSLAPQHHAAWLRVTTRRTEAFAGLDGAARARNLPGIQELVIAEPGAAPRNGPARTLAHLVASGFDAAELEERLRAARALLVARFTPEPQAA